MKHAKAQHSFFLHCDACHHEVTLDGWMGKQHIGLPCPLCGADMLTESDYKVGRRVQWVIRVLRFLGLVRPAASKPRPGDQRVRLHYHNGRFTYSQDPHI